MVNSQGAAMGRRRRTPARRARHLPARSRSERGVAAVEFALVLPVLVMLLFGITTAGLAYNDNLSIANAAREGARLGSALDYQAGASTWASSVQQRVEDVYFNDSNTLADSQICVALESVNNPSATPPTFTTVADNGNTGCGTRPQLPKGMPVGSCAVVVWVQKPSSISLLVFPDYNFNIGASSVSIYGLTDQLTPKVCTTT